jgi:hypothetical protein
VFVHHARSREGETQRCGERDNREKGYRGSEISLRVRDSEVEIEGEAVMQRKRRCEPEREMTRTRKKEKEKKKWRVRPWGKTTKIR